MAVRWVRLAPGCDAGMVQSSHVGRGRRARGAPYCITRSVPFREGEAGHAQTW